MLVGERSGVPLRGNALVTLWRLVTEGPQRISELAIRAGIDVSTMSRLLRQLEQAGLVARGRNPDDLRSVEVHITELGLDVHRRVSEAAASIIGEVVAPWPADQRVAFVEYLQHFTVDLVDYLERSSRGERE